MSTKSKKPTVKGRVAQVDICPSEAGFVLSVGPVSLWLDAAVAEDVVETLAQALALEVSGSLGGRAAAEQAELGGPGLRPASDRRRKSN